ncbi:MAG: HAD family hydrolase [Phycisphaeraceae bacterium]|nr:HAD family hydrolase [Phycisphaeraceae bacterium]
MSAPDVRMVVFDLGGVVVRICRDWAEGCAAAGLPFRDGALLSAEMKTRRRAVSARHGRGEISCVDYYREMSATTGGLYTPEEVERIHHAWTRDEYPGVDALVHRLHEAGLETGVLSNTNHAHWMRLAPARAGGSEHPEYATPSLIRHLHASHIMRLLKPDREIYAAFARATGFDGAPGSRGHPAHIVFFDDLPENVAAADAAGWRAFQVDHAGDTAAQMTRVLREVGIEI